MSKEISESGRIFIYHTEKGDTKLDVYFSDDTVWLTQKTIAQLYQTRNAKEGVTADG